MIKLDNYEVMGWEHVIRGMRNPMNSWEKSGGNYRYTLAARCDDFDAFKSQTWDKCNTCEVDKLLTEKPEGFMIGPNDHNLMIKLAKGGSVHAKYRRMITVYVDITAPLYWWKEFDTYKVGTVANSCSTMHKIHERDLTIDDFSHEHLSSTEEVGVDGVIGYFTPIEMLKATIDMINYYRKSFIEDGKTKEDWYHLIQLLPSSYNQKRTVMLNYEVSTNIYEYRKNHKLDEWVEFCKWIETLPYSEIITGEEK